MKPPAATSSSASSRGSKRAGWWTHGLPPKSGTVTTDAAQRLAAIGGTGRHDFRAGWTGRRATRGPRTAGRRGSRGAGARQQPSRPRGHGLGPSDSPAPGADVWARPAAPAPGPRPLCPSPGRSPRSPSRGTGSAPPRGGDRPARQTRPRLFRAVGSRGRGRRTVADAPSAPARATSGRRRRLRGPAARRRRRDHRHHVARGVIPSSDTQNCSVCLPVARSRQNRIPAPILKSERTRRHSARAKNRRPMGTSSPTPACGQITWSVLGC